MRRGVPASVTLLTALLLCRPQVAAGSGFAIPEIGTRKTGMGAVIGRPDELDAVYHNPAGLTLVPGTRLYLSFGTALIGTNLRLHSWEGSDQFIDAPVDAAGYYPRVKPTKAFGVVPMIVAATNLFSPRLWGAVSFYVPNAIGAAFDEHAVTRYHLIDSYLVTALGGVTLACRVRPWLSVGAGFSLVYVRIHGRSKIFPIVDGEDQSQFLGAESELTLTGSDLAPSFNAGVLLRPHPSLTLGAAAISRSDAVVEGPVVVQLGPDALIQQEIRGTQRTGIVIPWTLMAGANWDVARYVEVGAEVRLFLYHDWKTQHTDISGIPIMTEREVARDYHDSWHVSGGVRVHDLAPVPRLEGMLGLQYDDSPAPSRTVSLDQPSFDNVGLHVGLRYRLNATYRAGLTYSYYWYLKRTVTNSEMDPPFNFIGFGGCNLVTVTLEAAFGGGLGMRR